MKKLIILLPAFLILSASSAAQGLQNKKHTLHLGVEVMHFTYKEPMDTPIKDTGMFWGPAFNYLYRSDSAFFIEAEGRFLKGDMEYDGYLSDGTPYYVDSFENFLAEGQLKLGPVFAPGESWELRPYIGLAGRHLTDNMYKESPYAYKRTDLYIYAPIGLKAQKFFDSGAALTIGGEFDWFISGTQKSRTSDVNPGYNDLTFDQESGYGLRFSAKFEKYFKHAGLFIEPFFRYWHIKESEPSPLFLNGMYQGHYIEPDNNTTEVGIKAGFVF